jgi:hypothetical protein
MRKKLLFMFFAIGAFALLTSETHYSSASPGAKTGSPGDGASCTQCHSGSTINVDGWIESNIPESGYVDGETYTFTLTATHEGVSRFGFEATVEDANNAKVGTIMVTNAIENTLVNASHAITHKFAGTSPTGDTKTWSFDWTAPASGTGIVTIYAAFNAANGNGMTSGDKIYLSSLEIIENTVGVESIIAKNPITIYPSPFENSLTISTEIEIKEIRIYNLAASLVSTQSVDGMRNIKTINTENLETGLYFISILSTDGKQYTQKAVKK